MRDHSQHANASPHLHRLDRRRPRPPGRGPRGALRERGASAEIVDGLQVGGPVARAIVGGASSLETTAGNLAFEAGYLLGTKTAPMRRAGSVVIEKIMRKRFERYLREHPADVIVSTYPITTELLGRMRQSGALRTPTVSAITDLAALNYWAHPGIDLHLITHPESKAEVREIAGPATRIEAVHGLTDPRFRVAARARRRTRGARPTVARGRRRRVRRRLGRRRPARGDRRGAALRRRHGDRAGGHATSARTRRMTEAYAGDERVQVWGFTDKMVTLLAAADVLIHSTAGLTVLEALMCDCRVISYGWARGHVRVNNRAYEELGLVAVARNRPQLAKALVEAILSPRLGPQIPELPAAADLILGLARRRRRSGRRRLRRRAARCRR